MRFPLPLLALLALAPAARAGDGSIPFRLEDRFGRPLEEHGVTLLDWEGMVANPRVELVVRPDAGIPPGCYPLCVRIHGSDPRLLLDRFSELTDERSSKTILVEKPGDVARFELDLYPDRDGADAEHELVVVLEDALETPWRRTYAVHEVDRDVERPPGLAITLDLAEDTTGFLAEPPVQAVLRRAADDLGDLLDDQGFAPVPAGEEALWVWNADGFHEGHEVTNAAPYTGFLLLVHGIRSEERHSGSCASDRRPDALQHRGDEVTGLRRSGTVSLETTGNWNGLGWYVDASDPKGWLRSRNLDADKHDLLSIVRHEMLHALAYHRAHPAYAAHVQDGHFVDDALRAYLGADPVVDEHDHLAETVDPVSGFGAFGNEYGTRFPWRRWLPTEVDLLVLRALGYRLRPHTALTPLALAGPDAVEGRVGAPLAATLQVQGGVPDLCFTVADGALPPGVTLDSWTGALAGVPTEAGTFALTVLVRDSRVTAPEARHALSIRVAPAAEPAAKGSEPAKGAGGDGGGGAGPEGGGGA